jgi:hypothetical protein
MNDEMALIRKAGIGDCDDYNDNGHCACPRVWFDAWFLDALQQYGRYGFYVLDGNKLRRTDNDRIWILTDQCRDNQRLGVWPD